MFAPMRNNHFYLEGIEYYKERNKYYADNGTIREELSEVEWRNACFSFYLNL